MEVLEAIKTRRSIAKVEDREIPKELIKEIIEAGTYAPNRYLTEPWRFFVISGEGRNKLSKVMEDIAIESLDNLNSEEALKKIEKQKNKAFRAPTIIAVAAKISENPKVLKIEEIGAVDAAIENMLLAAHSLGIASFWKTGNACYSPKMKEFFGLEEKDEVLGFIYIGYPAMEKKTPPKKNSEELTIWIE